MFIKHLLRPSYSPRHHPLLPKSDVDNSLVLLTVIPKIVKMSNWQRQTVDSIQKPVSQRAQICNQVLTELKAWVSVIFSSLSCGLPSSCPQPGKRRRRQVICDLCEVSGLEMEGGIKGGSSGSRDWRNLLHCRVLLEIPSSKSRTWGNLAPLRHLPT